MRRRLEDAKRRDVSTGTALQGGAPNHQSAADFGSDVANKDTLPFATENTRKESLWRYFKNMEYGFGVTGGYFDVGGMECGGVMLRMEVDPFTMLGIEMRLGVWRGGENAETDKKKVSWKNYDWDYGEYTITHKGGYILAAELGLLGKLPRGKLTLLGGGGCGTYGLVNIECVEEGYNSWHGPFSLSESEDNIAWGTYVLGGLEYALSPNTSLLGVVRYTFPTVFYGHHIDYNLDGLGVEIGVTMWLGK